MSRNQFTGWLDEDIGELLAMDAVERLVVSKNRGLGGWISTMMGRMEALQVVGLPGDGL